MATNLLRVSRRHRRAARTRAQALSPVRIAMRVLALPGLTLVVALSVYIRTSPYDPEQAILHLIARTGCENARSVGLAPALRGDPGYHARNDADADGVACEVRHVAATQSAPSDSSAQTRFVGGAKFVRP